MIPKFLSAIPARSLRWFLPDAAQHDGQLARCTPILWGFRAWHQRQDIFQNLLPRAAARPQTKHWQLLISGRPDRCGNLPCGRPGTDPSSLCKSSRGKRHKSVTARQIWPLPY